MILYVDEVQSRAGGPRAAAVFGRLLGVCSCVGVYLMRPCCLHTTKFSRFYFQTEFSVSVYKPNTLLRTLDFLRFSHFYTVGLILPQSNLQVFQKLQRQQSHTNRGHRTCKPVSEHKQHQHTAAPAPLGVYLDVASWRQPLSHNTSLHLHPPNQQQPAVDSSTPTLSLRCVTESFVRR